MSEGVTVPRLVFTPSRPTVETRAEHQCGFYYVECEDCGFRMQATTYDALKACMKEHVDYVNATEDRHAGPHFHDIRVALLLSDLPFHFPSPKGRIL